MANKYIKDLLSKASKEEKVPDKTQITLPFAQLAGEPLKDFIDRRSQNDFMDLQNRKIQRSESLFDPPQVSDLVIQKHQKEFKPDSSIFLKERAILKYKI